jgi:NAD+ kinase
MKIAAFYTKGKKNIKAVLKDLNKAANDNGISIVFYDGEKEKISGCDFVVAVGGDGTFLMASSIIYDYDIPLLGINLGGLGFLTDIRKEEINKIFAEIKNGNYRLQERFFLRTNFRGKEYVALNDVVFSSRDIRIIDLDIYINDSFVTQLSGDGLIVATPTGSTAYSLSSGGPILEPNAKVFVVTPISPHALTFRPLVLNQESRILIKTKEKCQLILDGQRLVNLNLGDEVSVERNPNPLKVVKFKNWDYYDILRTKLNWGNG